MKKIVSIFAGLVGFCNLSHSQDVFFTLEYKTGPDSFYVYMTPGFSDATFNMGLSQVTIVFNSTFPVSNPPSSSIALTSVALPAWTAQDFAQEPGGAQKKFVTFLTLGAAMGNVNSGDKILLFRYRVTGGNCLGGTSSRNFVNGTDPVDPASNFGDFTAFINVDGIDHLSSNVNISLLTCAQLVLPVHILDFNVRRDNNNGVINWSASGEEFNSDYYELERSTDGINFQVVARIECRELPGIQRYEYVDQNIARLSAKYVYYRLKQYDKDAKFIQSSVRQLRFDIAAAGIQMYPNPVKTGFYVNIPFTNPDQSKVTLVVLNNAGQPVQSREITAVQASNYYFDIKNVHLAAGDYYLRIMYKDELLDLKKFLVAKE